MFPLLAVLLAGPPWAAGGAAADPPRGVVIDEVVCAADAGQSYALYLPSAYARDRSWPIVYLFDPGARGPLPVRLFSAAAEKFGYILAGSNNSRNGPPEPIARAIRAVWTDTRERLRIDDGRVYSAGFSGGGSVALKFGLFLGRPWAGAISCCGGLPDMAPIRALPGDLAVFLVTGLHDFNYWPTRNIGLALDAAGIASRLEVFPGGHSWPPAGTVMDALSWLELQAMKGGRRERDEAWIASQFESRLRRAGEIEQAGKFLDAGDEYRALAADFRGLVGVARAESAAARLDRPAERAKRRKALKAAEKEEAQMLVRANGTMSAFMNAATARERSGCRKMLGIAGLRRQAAKGEDSLAGLTASRVLGFLSGQAVAAAHQAYGRGDLEAARQLFELVVLVEPGDGNTWYNLACVHSRLRNKKEALRALETAALNGFKDWQAMEKDADLDALRREPAYLRLLEALKKDSPAGSVRDR